MKYITINAPLKSVEPQGIKAALAGLNIAESKLRIMIPDTKIPVKYVPSTHRVRVWNYNLRGERTARYMVGGNS